jgi:hypothetical protein
VVVPGLTWIIFLGVPFTYAITPISGSHIFLFLGLLPSLKLNIFLIKDVQEVHLLRFTYLKIFLFYLHIYLVAGLAEYKSQA